MKSFKNNILKTIVFIALLMFSPDLSAAEPPAVPWRNLKVASELSTFYFLVALAVFQFILIVILAGVLKSLVSGKDLWIKKTGAGKIAPAMILVFMMLPATSAFAQQLPELASQPVIVMDDNVFWVLVAINIFLMAILFALLLLIRGMLQSLQPEKISEAVIAKQDIWSGSLNAAVPVEREGEIMMDHDYDGIRELDNNLPPWWVWGFYSTIAFAAVYIGYYHITGKGALPLEEYKNELTEASRQKEEFLAKSAARVDENSVIAFTEAAQINKGKETFINMCAACHGKNGEGIVGPNFTDEYWLHGGGIKNIFKTIKYGVPEKGMIAWETQLSPVQIQEVASYIVTLKGTNPANAKPPQGDLWKEAPAKTDSVSADTLRAVVETK